MDTTPHDRLSAHISDDLLHDLSFVLLKERYLVQQLIARGGMARVYRGLDLQEQRPVALKILQQTPSTPAMYLEHWRREGYLHAPLIHSHIVQLYDRGQQDDLHFLVLEWIDGVTLCYTMQVQRILCMSRALEIAHALALALSVVHHDGLVHQDVKPLNVMLGQDGEVKLIDFGIARIYRGSQPTDEKAQLYQDVLLGTPHYLSPEQAQGLPISPTTDIYALGIVLYEMLTGRRPFLSDMPEVVAAQHVWEIPPPPTRWNPLISSALEAVVLRCLEKRPEQRFQDGTALAHALAHSRSGLADDLAYTIPVAIPVISACGVDDPENITDNTVSITEGLSDDLPNTHRKILLMLQIVASLCCIILLIVLSLYLTSQGM
jgi:serine/threonine-protein kinase